ncbi:MAG: hypothetical protein ACRDNL_04600, partial [Spirillospora sp.]
YWVKNGSYAQSLKPVLKDVTAKDDATVEITLKQPFNLIALMARTSPSPRTTTPLCSGATRKSNAEKPGVLPWLKTGLVGVRTWLVGRSR